MLIQTSQSVGQVCSQRLSCFNSIEWNPSGRHKTLSNRQHRPATAVLATQASPLPAGEPLRQEQASGSAHVHLDAAWRSLSDIVWEGSEADALLESSPLAREHPLWRLLLLSDGSVTRHLQLLTGSSVTVDCLSMEPVPSDDSQLPLAVAELEHPLLQREVLLRNMDDGGRALVHATSWWNVDAATRNLQDPSKPIWVSLSQARKELYREIKVVRLGHSPVLAEHFAEDGPFWGRQYLFWSGGAPLTLIHEVFSPALVGTLL